MEFKVVSRETLLQARQNATYTVKIPYGIGGEMHFVEKRLTNGFIEDLGLKKPIGEMITSQSLRPELIEKIVLDVDLGREQVPLLYQPLYERMENRDFPEIISSKWAQYGVVVFTQHSEGEEVSFGHLEAEQGPKSEIFTYAAGFVYTEDMQVYNKTWEMEAYNRAFGEAHNALLNHIHFSPIISSTYKTANKTSAQGATDDPTELKYKKTIEAALEAAAIAKRPGTILLASGGNRYKIEKAMQRMIVNGTEYGETSGIDTYIYYDGWDIKVGKKSSSYSGVDSGKAYLIRPKRGFKELIKHDLLIDSGNPDITRLVEASIVGRSRRGVYAAIEENVQEITLPS